MKAEQQSLSAELSLPQKGQGARGTESLCCRRQRILLCQQDVLIVEGSERGIGVQLEQLSGTIRNSFFMSVLAAAVFITVRRKKGRMANCTSVLC